MKSTGVVRRIDDLGRIVLPKELRRTHSIDEGTPMEIFVDGDKIIVKKYQPGCQLCGSVSEGMVQHSSGKLICKPCTWEFRDGSNS